MGWEAAFNARLAVAARHGWKISGGASWGYHLVLRRKGRAVFIRARYMGKWSK